MLAVHFAVIVSAFEMAQAVVWPESCGRRALFGGVAGPLAELAVGSDTEVVESLVGDRGPDTRTAVPRAVDTGEGLESHQQFDV